MCRLTRAATLAVLVGAAALSCPAQEWTEAAIIESFLAQSPRAREARANVAIAEAEARGRTLFSNPSVNNSREGAGFTEFFQAEQALPITGRRKLLRQAGASLVRATEADGAFSLWQARSSLRHSFYRLLASQEREAIHEASLKDIEDVIRVLRDREREGEGSKFDRLRTDRERAELLAELALVRAQTVLERAQVLAFLPAGTALTAVSGRADGNALAGLERRRTSAAIPRRPRRLSSRDSRSSGRCGRVRP